MRILCSNCSLNCNTNEYKEKIDDLLIKKNNNLLDDEIIGLSEIVNELITNCIFCNSNNLRKSKGRFLHEKLYYYGDKHLLINLYSYMSEALKNKQLIYISMGKERYDRLMDVFMVNRVSVNNVILKPLEEITFIKKTIKCYNNIKKQVDNFFYYNENQYNGIRWIIDTEYIESEKLEKIFLQNNNKTHEYVKNMNINILYIFNAYECMHKDKKILLEEM